MDSSQATSAPQHTWRLRAELNDRPGALARLTASLAALDCNILALTVLPVPGGVVDDLVISTPDRVRPADLVTLVRSVGGSCAGITRAELTDLTDAPTAALRVAGQLAGGAIGYPEAVRELVDADSAEPAGPAAPGAEPGGRQVVLPAGPDAEPLMVRRGWAAFTEVELARSAALAELAQALDGMAGEPRAVLTSDGAGVVLREGRPADADAVSAMHDRCSRASLFTRYHAGTRSMPLRLLHRLLAPPRGRTVVGVVGHQVVALGQLINTTDPAVAEVSLLVEDDWQGRGLGSALLGQLAGIARAAGHRELVGWCLPEETGLLRAARRAGLPSSTTRQDELLRGSLDLRPLQAVVSV